MTRVLDVCERRVSADEVLDAVRRPDAGGVALFLGVVRDHNEGRAVTLLE